MSCFLSYINLNSANQKHLLLLIFVFVCSPTYSQTGFLEPSEVNLVNPPTDSLQKTMWKDYPVIVHHRTKDQINALKKSFDGTPSAEKRLLAYRSIARSQGHELASIIMEFTEKYISTKNVYMSEIPEFGVFSMVSPILGCSIFKDDEGFVDPCNGVRFDYAGKVINHKGYDHLRLTIPPHKIIDKKLVFLDDYKAKEIVDFTPDIMAMNSSDIDKAIFAVDFERLDILKDIIVKSPNVLLQQNTNGSTILQVAAFHQSTIDYLLNFEDVQINHINKAGYTALLFAIYSRNFDNAEKLVRQGARLDSFSLNGVSAKSVEEFVLQDMYFDEPTAAEFVEHLKKIQLESTAMKGSAE